MALVKGYFDLYSKNKYTDVTLITVDEKKFNCHKFVLGAVSNVFEKKFLEDNESTREIKLDITSDSFSVIINYIYRDQLKIDSENVAIDLYKFAFKYEIQNLMIEVKKYVSDIPNVRSALKCLNKLKDFGIENILDCYKKVVKENVHKVIESEEFLDCPLELVVELTSVDELSVSEIELFNGVQKWVNHKKELEGAVCADNLKIVYEDLVKNIRFLTMTRAEFFGSPFNSYLLDDNDKMSILANICIPGSAPLPEGFSTSRTNRDISSLNMFENIILDFYFDTHQYIQWQTLNITKLNFYNGKQHISPMVELKFNKGSFSIIMKLNVKNNEEFITVGLQNCNKNRVDLRIVYFDIKNSHQHFESFRQFLLNNGFILDKNEIKEFIELPLKEIKDRGCLVDNNLNFEVHIAFF